MTATAWAVLGAVAGAAVGALIGGAVKCRGGSCPLTGSPWRAAILGALAGGLLGSLVGPRRNADSPNLVSIAGPAQFEQLVLQADKPVLVDFYADWCGPCRNLAPTISQLADEYAGRAVIAKVNVDDNQALASQYNVTAIPALRLIVGGQVRRTLGPADIETYRAAIDEALASQPPTTNQTTQGDDERKDSSMSKRTVTMKGNPVGLTGNAVNVGDKAPAFTAVGNDLNVIDCMGKDVEGKVEVIVAVPSLDTSVCDKEARRFNEEAAKLGDKVRVTVISMDLPFAQKRWCAANGIEQVRTVSDYRDGSFGQAYGVLMKDLRLLARSVFVVGKDGKVQYVQIVDEVTDEPDYDAALAAARKAAQS